VREIDRQQRIRVVHVSLQLDVGGMEKLLVEFARHADRRRFELRFVSMTTRGQVAEEIAELGWPVVAMDEPPGFRPGLSLRLAGLLRGWRTDVIHMHNGKPLVYGAPAAHLARVRRIIYTRHGQRHNATVRQNLLFRMATRLVDRVVCVSKDSAARSVSDGLHPSRISTIWNGIDVSRFAYAGPADRAPVVMVGRLSPEKDVETLLRAVAIARSQDARFRLQVAGNGECMAHLKQSAGDLGLAESVTFLGNVENIPSLLGKASMSVLSSVSEGISLTLLEAMARGLPVVATSVGGNPEIIVDGETGLLVPAQDPALLAKAMLSIWRNPETGRKMGIAGRRRVEEHFDVRRMVSEYEKLYLDATAVKEVLSRHERGALSRQ
jgi:glycosyltransferase involved in cell wall biosynthesis